MSRLLDLKATKVVFIGAPDDRGNRGKIYHLAGANAGDENVTMGPDPKGHYFAPIHILSSSSARQDGATPLRTVRDPREWSFDVHIGADNEWDFLAANDLWWRNWSSDRDAFMCFYQQFSGWWTVPVRFSGEADPLTGVDPQAEYFESYTMHVTAFDPAYQAIEESFMWTNTLGLNEGGLLIPNRGTLKLWPRYTMNGPGKYFIEDPLSDENDIRVVQTPTLLPGETLRIDTFERRQTARVYSISTGPNGRNVWAQLQGRRWLFPIYPSTVGESGDVEPTEIRVIVEGGNVNSHVIATTTQRMPRPF
ncbi:phage tail protein [Antrihabitans sp. NCIMB 15449]|uniref:Phage tail protein n=1 Tax=Antrihabitans spumae TaxID=3373370 RepID=A0ABW7JMP4_9NOCA